MKVVEEYVQCPCCGVNGVAVVKGKIVRHEAGRRYVPYNEYCRFSKKDGIPVKEWARRNLCEAIGKTVKQLEEDTH